jgi:hypothetical protein
MLRESLDRKEFKMQISYVVRKNRETKSVDVIARFVDGVAEIYKTGKWQVNAVVYGMLEDVQLEYVSETEALRLIAMRNERESQAA